MAQRKTLIEQQLGLLRWSAVGCPDVMMSGVSHRISAASLRNRGLVEISGRGPTWSARVTRAGTEYLERAASSDPPVPRQANVSVTQRVVDDVIAAGGALHVPRRRWDDRTSIDYAERARLAVRCRKVPAGKRRVTSSDGDELEIRLVDAPELASAAELVTVSVNWRR